MYNRQPDISVITVNYNGFQDTCEFIDSWTTTVISVSYEIIVIDNGSTMNEAALLQKKYPAVRTLRSEKNRGFAGGNNLGMSIAKGNFLFLLNNDILMVNDTVHLLVRRLALSEKAAGVSPLIRDCQPPYAIQFAGYTRLSSVTLRNKAVGERETEANRYPACQTPYLHGAAMLLKKTAVKQTGPMSEEYFLYYEELDWCTRMTTYGYELWYDPACEVQHKGSRSTGKKSPLQCYYLSRNRLIYAYRNLSGWKRCLSILYQLTIVYPKNMVATLGKGRQETVQAHWRGINAFFKFIIKDK